MPAPSLRRRAACLLYEIVVLFGVALVPGAIATATNRFTPANLQSAVEQAIGFLCFGAYFVWMWTHSGQTLPMQTWRIRLVTREGHTLSTHQAVLRFLLAWMWVLPAILVAHAAGWQRWTALGATALWALCYGVSARWLPERQCLHDVLCRTKLICWPR